MYSHKGACIKYSRLAYIVLLMIGRLLNLSNIRFIRIEPFCFAVFIISMHVVELLKDSQKHTYKKQQSKVHTSSQMGH